jgi:hypothetical protein
MGKKKTLVITMRDIIGIAAVVLAGVIIGYFGVLGSISTAVEPNQRINMFGGISLLYFFVGAVLGLLLPRYSWKWGLFLSAPGALLLGFFLLKEFNSYFLLYMVSIIFFACIGAWDGKILRNRRKKEHPSKEQSSKEQLKRERAKKENPKLEQIQKAQSKKDKPKKDKSKKKQHKR